MASFECGKQIKREVQSVDDEVLFQKHDVKSEYGRKGDANMPINDLEENDKLKVTMLIDKFDPEKIKIEENFFIPRLDLKSEKCENTIIEDLNLKACEEELFSYENGYSNSWQNHNEAHAILLQNVTEDLKPVGLTADTGNVFVETEKETFIVKKEEIFNENIPSAPDEMKFAVEDDHVVKPEMEPTTERINELYNSADCSNLKISQKLHSGENSFQCKICSKSFAKAGSLKYHEKVHTGEKPFQCQICSKSFSQSHNLKYHEKIHSGEKPFQCKICSKSFIRNSELIKHEKTHSGERPFQCQICPKSFIQNSELIIHGRTHSGEKPFRCQICSKSFSRSNKLKCHEKIHTGEKRFPCKICSKSFIQNDVLIRHEKTHSGKKPFQCQICSKSFSRSDNLKHHKKIHTGEKPFQCEMCSKSFMRRTQLKNHETIHTTDKTLH
ncbi:uncharacterized protein isoform X1 [Leptinotarsa decemlineata]|uniref:uncharacterized protein isoform X1 n=1 Tax=Leptinotarsa decemlineata TaxID=7539 RepID=UPI000C2536F2|nr:zinc finger protein OZF-like [Leptinotarsa decemlineata]